MIRCPRCSSTNIKKNGYTHYGVQNHKCKVCQRQFVLNSTHYIRKEKRALIKHSLKERISLRGICRVFAVSLTWLQAFAHEVWEETPKHLGITRSRIKQIKRLQVFGIQADEMWSFVQKKKNKRWIWIAFDPVLKVVIAYHIGNRGEQDAKKLWGKIPKRLRGCKFETDDWDAYKSVIPANNHKIGKDLTYHIEGFNAGVRARVSRLVRKSLSFSKVDNWHNKAIAWFFWQLNLERLQPYI